MGRKSVVHSRLEHLTLQDIQAVQLNLPELYDNLMRLQRENRNTYKPAQRVQTGCYQIPYIGEQNRESAVDMNKAQDEQQDDSDMSVVEEATDEVQKATEGVQETTDKFDDDDEDFQEDKGNTESENNHRYNLRFRKILKVQMADMQKVEVPCKKSWKIKIHQNLYVQF